MTNEIIEESRKIARSYYSAQRFINQFVLMTETVCNFLIEKGWKAKEFGYGKPFNYQYYDLRDSRSLMIKKILSGFEKNDLGGEFRFVIRFYFTDPEKVQPWIPIAFFYRLNDKMTANKINRWNTDDKIANFLRPLVLEPSKNVVYLKFPNPTWPEEIKDNEFEKKVESIQIVPVPLGSIKDSEILEIITLKAIEALENDDPEKILLNDKEYLEKVWGI